MENEPTRTPQNAGQSNSSPSFGKGIKNIQPLSNDLKSPVPNIPPHPAEAEPTQTAPQTVPQTVADTQAPTPAPKPNISSIYPDATLGLTSTGAEIPKTEEKEKSETKSFTFKKGYHIGSSIFWFQLLVGIVLGLILLGIEASVLKTAKASLIIIVILFYYAFELFVLIYVPYSVMKSNALEEPFWLGLFGAAIQIFIVSNIAIIFGVIIISLTINHGNPLISLTTGGLKTFAVVFFVGIFIAAYFSTKLSYGLEFVLLNKIKNKVIIKVIGIGIITLFVGGIVYHYITFHKATPKIYGTSSQTLNIPKQTLSSSTYTSPINGFQITPPAGWTVANPPGVLTWWYYQNNIMDELLISTSTSSGGSLQSIAQDWSTTKQSSVSNYKLISSSPTTINGIPAYYITDSWDTKTLKPQPTADQVVIEDYNGTLYTVDGNYYTQYSSSFSSVLKQSLFSFKP